jgi:chromosome partitioning protein
LAVISIIAQKGGSGKTTLAVHLAAAAQASGQEACIIDMDPQRTATAWGKWRGGAEPEIVDVQAGRPGMLAGVVQRVAELGAKIVVIDTPPHADAIAREAASVADLVLIPTRPRGFDLHAIQSTASLVRETHCPAFVVFNAVPPRGVQVCMEAASLVATFGIPLCPIAVTDRAAFHHATTAGKVAGELDPAGKAAAEAQALWEFVAKRAAGKKRRAR